MSKSKQWMAEIGLVALLVAIGVAGRMLPHPANFTPVAATALFAAFVLRSRLLALVVPVVTMLISNYFEEWTPPAVALAVMVGMSFPLLLRGLLRESLTCGRLVGCALLSSCFFYVITNLAVWQFSPAYTHDLAGLVRCFTVALPFFRNTLAGDMAFTALFFGSYALAQLWQSRGLWNSAYATNRVGR
ncbi:MAG TPA: DUF6580 family putative transport protein [Pirellulaceae bacterium]|nr:DUF6580 family putative transport protein [Pirellulaceae bacterium]